VKEVATLVEVVWVEHKLQEVQVVETELLDLHSKVDQVLLVVVEDILVVVEQMLVVEDILVVVELEEVMEQVVEAVV
jgi:hypothetical protein